MNAPSDRSIWGDEIDPDDDIIVIRTPHVDEIIPERVPDRPRRKAPPRLSDVLEQQDTSASDWIPGKQEDDDNQKNSLEPFLKVVGVARVVIGIGVLLGGIFGIGFVVFLAFRQYGLL